MIIKPIRSEADYDAAMARLDQIWDPDPGTQEADELAGSEALAPLAVVGVGQFDLAIRLPRLEQVDRLTQHPREVAAIDLVDQEHMLPCLAGRLVGAQQVTGPDLERELS
jgi:hypothetical protein